MKRTSRTAQSAHRDGLSHLTVRAISLRANETRRRRVARESVKRVDSSNFYCTKSHRDACACRARTNFRSAQQSKIFSTRTQHKPLYGAACSRTWNILCPNLLIIAIGNFLKFLGKPGARLHSTLIHHPFERAVNQDAVQPCTGIMCSHRTMIKLREKIVQ